MIDMIIQIEIAFIIFLLIAYWLFKKIVRRLDDIVRNMEAVSNKLKERLEE